MHFQWRPVVLGVLVGVMLSVILTLVTNLKGNMDEAILSLSVDRASDVDSTRLACIFLGAVVGSLIVGIGYKGKLHFLVTMLGSIAITIFCGLTVHNMIELGADNDVTLGFTIFGVIIGFLAWLVGFITHRMFKKQVA